MPCTTEYLMNRLAELGLQTETIEHPPLRTVAESKQLRGKLPGAHVKNLFLKDKYKRYWLIVAQEDANINLKELAGTLNAGKFTFASAEDLFRILGITPGAVSPLAAINDTDKLVTVVLDQRLMDVSPLNFHPLRNDLTTSISVDDFMTFLQSIDHLPQFIHLQSKPAELAGQGDQSSEH